MRTVDDLIDSQIRYYQNLIAELEELRPRLKEVFPQGFNETEAWNEGQEIFETADPPLSLVDDETFMQTLALRSALNDELSSPTDLDPDEVAALIAKLTA